MEVQITNGDKVDAIDLIKYFTVSNDDNFIPYLKEIFKVIINIILFLYKDLSLRNESKLKGISKITFVKV